MVASPMTMRPAPEDGPYATAEEMSSFMPPDVELQLDPRKRHMQRLVDAIQQCRLEMEPLRVNRLDSIKLLVGAHYSWDGTNERQALNYMELVSQIYLRSMAANNPAAFVTTRYQGLKAVAYDLQLALQHLIKEIRFSETIRRWVLEAFFGVGILKTGINPSKTRELGGFTHDPAQPFADVVDLDDLVWDTNAKRWDEMTFIGNRYRLPMEAVMEAGIYNPEVLAKLTPSQRNPVNEQGDEKANNIARGQRLLYPEFLDFVELWDVWLPVEGRIVTIATDYSGSLNVDMVLRDVEWMGPESGPYHLLSFFEVPGNLPPLAPVSTVRDLHELINELHRKCRNQALRQKTVGVARGEPDEIQKIQSAKDGDTVGLTSPNAVEELQLGGVNQTTLAFLIQNMQEISYMNGNLDVMGGLSPQADTLGQEQLLQGNSNKRLADMSDRLEGAVTLVLRDLAYYLFYNPDTQVVIQKPIPGTGLSVESLFSPETAEGDFLDYNIEIQPYSMQHQTPAMKLQTILNTVQNVIMPLGPVMEAQGITLNCMELVNKMAELSNTPELRDILIFQQPLPDQQPIGEAPQRKSVWDGAHAARPEGQQKQYLRKSVGAGRGAQMGAMMQSLMGKSQQPAEAARMTG